MFRRWEMLLKLLASPRKLRQALFWANNEWSLPAPQEVKWSVLRRYGSEADIWIETGTFLGETTKMLSSLSRKVITILPSEDLFLRASKKFAADSHVQVLNGDSETLIRGVLEVCNSSVGLWLDGHYSGGETFKGHQVTPILDELEAVQDFVNAGGSGVVFVDDVRLFDSPGSGYPSRHELTSWADRNHAWWTIEHDIFVSKFGDFSPDRIFTNLSDM